MDKEQLLKAEIEKLISMGKANGSVTEEEIIAKLEKISVTPEEMEVVFKALAEAKITIKENESRVELAPDVARHVMRSMQNGTINEFLVVCKAVSAGKEVNAKGEAKPSHRRGGKGGKPSQGSRGKGRVVRR